MSTKKASSQNDKPSIGTLESHFSGTDLAHAYHLVSDDPCIVERIREYLVGKIPEERAHLDVLIIESPSFGIEDVRKLRGSVSQRSFSGRRFVVLRAQAFTEEAQQGLLKTVEEPGLGNHFFFITNTKRAETLLPTLRSRLTVLHDSLFERTKKTDVSVKNFLESTPAARLLFVRRIIESEEGGQAEELFRGIEIAIKESIERGDDVSFGAFYRELIRLGEYLGRPSGNMKMILEHLALICPVFPVSTHRSV